MRLAILLLPVVTLCQTAPDPRAKKECDDTAARLNTLVSALPKEGDRPKACAALRDEAENQLRLTLAAQASACGGQPPGGLAAAQKAEIERRVTASSRMKVLLRDCEAAIKAIEPPPAPKSAAEARKTPGFTSCDIYKQSWNDRQIEKRFAAIRKVDPESAKCKLELPTAYAAHCGTQKTEWPQDEFSTDLAGLIKISLEMSRCETELQIKK